MVTLMSHGIVLIDSSLQLSSAKLKIRDNEENVRFNSVNMGKKTKTAPGGRGGVGVGVEAQVQCV